MRQAPQGRFLQRASLHCEDHLLTTKRIEACVPSVIDEGMGFDTKEMRNKVGLGIGSMQGRARLLGGQFEIHSEPGKGARIEVWVPLQPQ